MAKNPGFRKLLDKLKTVTEEDEFADLLAETCEALEYDRNSTTVNVEEAYHELSDYFDNDVFRGDHGATITTLTTMADLHYSFGNTDKALEYYKGSLEVVKPKSCPCCPWIWMFYTYFCEAPKNNEEALREINDYLHGLPQKKGSFYAIVLFF